MSSSAEPLVVAPGEGHLIPRPDTGGAVTVKLPSETTNGAITVFETSRRQGDEGGPGLHSHPGFDEMFYVLDGEFVFTAGARTIKAGAGTFVYLPGGVFHAFHADGDADSRMLGISVPGGIEHAFEEVASLPAGTDPASVARAFRNHGIDFSG